MLALIDAFIRNPNGALPQEYTDMSPHAVNSFVNDLVAMAKAMEQVPELEEDVRALSKECDQKTNHIRELETHIIGYKDTITALQCTVRNLEAARDDAEYRFLETEDRYAKVADLVKAASLALGVAEPVLPQPEPVIVQGYETYVKQPEPINPPIELKEGESTTPPPFDPPPSDPAVGTMAAASVHDIAPQGQSEPLPTPATDTYSTQPATDTSKDTLEGGLASQSSEPDPEPTKYSPDGFITQAWWIWSDRNLYGKAAQ